MRALLAVILVATATSATAQMYRWTDSSGRVHFTDTPPPASAKNIQRRGTGTTATNPGSPSEPYALQVARKSNPVKLYSAPGCGAGCNEARRLLNARGVPFTEVSVVSEAQITELKDLIGTASVPTLVVGSNVRKGFEEGAYHAALDAGGYPKTGILRPRNPVEPKQPSAGDGDSEAEGKEHTEETSAPRGPYLPR